MFYSLPPWYMKMSWVISHHLVRMQHFPHFLFYVEIGQMLLLRLYVLIQKNVATVVLVLVASKHKHQQTILC